MLETNKGDVWKGVDYWTEEIKKAGLTDQLRPFNDLLTGNEAPQDGREPVIRNAVLDGTVVDIYHSDSKPHDSGHRLYIHKKSKSSSSADPVPYFGPQEQLDDRSAEAGARP